MSIQNFPERGIAIQVNYDGEQHILRTYTNEYRNLMMLIYDRIYTEGFGECLGMGKCGTCKVEIIHKTQEPSAYERNETITLLKSGKSCINIRLSCQLMIDERMDGLIIKVLK